MEDISSIVESIPETWLPLAIVAVGSVVVIFFLFKMISKQHDVIVKTVDHGQIMHELTSSMKEITRVTQLIHFLMSKEGGGK